MQMTRAEAEKYRDEITQKYWNRTISYKKFSELWDAVELLPYDLSAFPQLKPDTVEWINKMFLKDFETSRNGNQMLRGFTRCEPIEVACLNLHYGDYADAISFFAYNDEEMLIYTFTEGDTTLQIFNDKEKYEAEKRDMYNFYKAERSA